MAALSHYRGFTGKVRVAVAGFVLVAGSLAHADSLGDALGNGKTGFNLRYRYEQVDQASFANDATASTLRVRVHHTTGQWEGWSLMGELDYVLEAGSDEYNSGGGTSGPARSIYPVVADPDGFDLNQVYLGYQGDDGYTLRVGRQRILLDDQRFVGGVGWRQNEQTYDSASLKITALDDTELFYSYVANVNRIFGDDVPAGDHEQASHLFNIRRTLADNWKVTGYAYLLDNKDAAAFSTNTIGVRLDGSVDVEGGKVMFLGEFAQQSERADAPVDYSTSYYRVRGLWKRGNVTLGAGLESLGSDAGQAFRTPLATLHAFNGWADQFLGTPAGGLDDMYARVDWARDAWKVQVRYHDFSASETNVDYGTELDAAVSYKISKRYSALLKYANFSSDTPLTRSDATKWWLMVTASF